METPMITKTLLVTNRLRDRVSVRDRRQAGKQRSHRLWICLTTGYLFTGYMLVSLLSLLCTPGNERLEAF